MDEQSAEMTIGGWYKVVTNVASVLRRLKLGRLVDAVKDRARNPLCRQLHEDVIHPMRCFAVAVENSESANEAAFHAQTLCTRLARVMRWHLGLKQNELHCCLKVIRPKASPTDPTVMSVIARSEPRDHRPESADMRPGDANSIFCALMGLSDGTTPWPPFSCFCCNDLEAVGHRFKCDRPGWQEFYKSCLVYPLRFISSTAPPRYTTIGFLCFDSPRINAFRGLPNIFEHREDLPAYQDLLSQSAAFHLGALFADTLSMFLRHEYLTQGSQNENRTTPEVASGEPSPRSDRLFADNHRVHADKVDRSLPPGDGASAGGG